ncbi:hypothetical protein DERF_014347 [Dermatophagoides farinae]|uniref:Transmembrane protein n=1 Tax=Dermatophagoides farinae TaxID=6954 RepID=A0A922HHM3_DERFA|nr:hypothetical protein DERF_014347 [Dermatophagoides farinae]
MVEWKKSENNYISVEKRKINYHQFTVVVAVVVVVVVVGKNLSLQNNDDGKLYLIIISWKLIETGGG